jgi:hypothetical protein
VIGTTRGEGPKLRSQECSMDHFGQFQDFLKPKNSSNKFPCKGWLRLWSVGSRVHVYGLIFPPGAISDHIMGTGVEPLGNRSLIVSKNIFYLIDLKKLVP